MNSSIMGESINTRKEWCAMLHDEGAASMDWSQGPQLTCEQLEHHLQERHVLIFSLLPLTRTESRGGHRGVAASGEWSQPKGCTQCTRFSLCEERRLPRSVQIGDGRTATLSFHCHFFALGRFPSSPGNLPSSLRHLSLEATGPLRRQTGLRTRAGECSNRLPVPSRGLVAGTV